MRIFKDTVTACVLVYALLVTPAYIERDAPGDFEKLCVTWVFFGLVSFAMRDKTE